MRSASPGTPPPPSRPARLAQGKGRPRRPLTFRQIFLRVALAHLALFLLLAFWRLPAAKPSAGDQPMEFIALPPTPSSAGSAPPAPEPAAAPPAPTPVPQPTPQPTPPAPTPTPEPIPTPVQPQPPSEIVLPPKPKPKSPPKPQPPKPVVKPKPVPQPTPPEETEEEETPPTPAPKPAKPAPHRPKIDLTHEVTRGQVVPGTAGGKGAPTARNTGAAEGRGPGLQPSGVSNRLSQALSGSGTESRIVVGAPSGGGGGGGSAGSTAYYALIRRQMYGSWDQPTELADLHPRAVVQVHIARDGTVSGATVLASSGNAAYDASALAAARRVARIEKPRPDDVPETVTINFQLVE